ncbi:MAG: hypothetical protein LBK41_01020 [Clostridiales bacterium]|jgi:spore germination protein YaaH|nr:hypothetical protein [Clostridiales bacterium]
MNSGKSRLGGVIFIAGFVLLIGAMSVVFYLIDRGKPSNETAPYYEYYKDRSPERVYAVRGDKLMNLEQDPLVVGGELYFPFSFVKEHIDRNAFWDASAGRLIITTADEVSRFTPDSRAYTVNDAERRLASPIIEKGVTAYLPAGLVETLYGVSASFAEEYKLAVVDFPEDEKLVYTTPEGAALRFEPDIKSPIETALSAGQRLLGFGETDGFLRARTSEGLVGYVKAEETAFAEKIGRAAESPDKRPSYVPTGKINMVWDLIASKAASGDESRRAVLKNADVVSPTWFSFDGERLTGEIISIADKGYVDWAKANGCAVWGLISDNFDGAVAHAVLADSDRRKYVVDQLIALASELGLDGVNIDFEAVRAADADYFIQFLRELYPIARLNQLVVSVDTYVPAAHNLYYSRDRISEACDFIIIMGYDEYYAGSDTPGPVASIGFVEKGVADTLSEAPPEKVMLGVPYFTRIWKETEDAMGFVSLSSEAASSEETRRRFEQNGAVFTWHDSLGLYYATYDALEDGRKVTYEVWIEDARSLGEKLKIARERDLAGIAGWCANWLRTDGEREFVSLAGDFMDAYASE